MKKSNLRSNTCLKLQKMTKKGCDDVASQEDNLLIDHAWRDRVQESNCLPYPTEMFFQSAQIYYCCCYCLSRRVEAPPLFYLIQARIEPKSLVSTRNFNNSTSWHLLNVRKFWTPVHTSQTIEEEGGERERERNTLLSMMTKLKTKEELLTHRNYCCSSPYMRNCWLVLRVSYYSSQRKETLITARDSLRKWI